MKRYQLDEEEKRLLKEVEAGEWVRIKDFEKKKKELAEAARYSIRLKKNKNINIRVSEEILQKLKTKAAEEGLPYQTLISSVLHKFANKGE